ncbi:MAG: hypothetical protein PHU14_00190 [Methylovulum sp.]|nr:hypothetical protein [Methylovulum sp.]
MPKLTKEQWDDIRDKLSGTFGSVYLECDGYLVLAQVTQNKRKLVIVLYVDGWAKGIHIKHFKEGEESSLDEIPRKFYCFQLVKRDPANIKRAEKIYGKKKCKELGLYKKNYFTSSWFSSPSRFVSKIKKTCESVTVLDFETYRQKLKAKEGVDNAETL